MMERLLLIPVLMFAVQQSDAQPLTLYTDDFLTTPVGWTIIFNPPSSPPDNISTVDFGIQGASFSMYAWKTFGAQYRIFMTNPSVAVVPSGIDHLNLTAAQILHTGTYGAWAFGGIELLLNGTNMGYVYDFTDPGYLADPVNVDILSSEFGYVAGDTIGFKIYTSLLSMMDREYEYWWGRLHWDLTDFTLTAYDEEQLHRYTWGEIKTLP